MGSPVSGFLSRRFLPLGLAVLGAAAIVSFLSTSPAGAQRGDVLPPSSVSTAGTCFLKIEGVEGESTDDKHKGEIDLESWSWGETQAKTAGGGGAGKVSMQDFHFTMTLNKASVKLFLAVATGEHYKTAVLTCRKAGGQQQEYLTWKLSDVMVTSYQTSSSGQSVPVEQFSLNFTKIEFEYRPQKPDGSLDTAVKAGYDLKLNKKI